jgi:hypothetical protein
VPNIPPDRWGYGRRRAHAPRFELLGSADSRVRAPAIDVRSHARSGAAGRSRLRHHRRGKHGCCANNCPTPPPPIKSRTRSRACTAATPDGLLYRGAGGSRTE